MAVSMNNVEFGGKLGTVTVFSQCFSEVDANEVLGSAWKKTGTSAKTSTEEIQRNSRKLL